MTTLIIILAYILNVFFCRYLTYLAVKNQGKWLTVSYDTRVVWFIPGFGNLWCMLDFICSLAHRNSKGSNWFNNWFNGKDW